MNIENYIFVPLDIPNFNIDINEFLNFFDSKKALIKTDINDLKNIELPWNIYYLRNNDLKPIDNEIPGSGWHDDIRQKFHNFIDVVETLPFESIQRVYVLEQFKEVNPHQDVSRELDPKLGPSTFRYSLLNDEPTTTFYLLKENGDIIFPKLPKDTRWFGMNNYKAKHGSYLPTKRKLMFCIWGKVHEGKFLELLTKSIKKYQDYCILND